MMTYVDDDADVDDDNVDDDVADEDVRRWSWMHRKTMTSAPGRPEAAGQDFKPLAGQRRLRPDSIRFNEKTDDFVSFTYEKENEAPDTLPPSRNKKKQSLCNRII